MKSKRTRKNNKPKRNVQNLSLPGFTHVEKEIRLANGRVGITAVARLKWLLDFAYEDLSNLSQGQLSDRGWEVAALVIDLDFRTSFAEGIQLIFSVLDKSTPNDPTRKVSEHLIRKFHDLLRQGVDDFFKGSGWKITEPERERRIGLTGPPHHLRFMVVDGVRPEDQLIIKAFNLFDTEVDRLGNCRNPNCKRLFVAARKGRAFFCSPRCSAYVRVNMARGKTEKLKGI